MIQNSKSFIMILDFQNFFIHFPLRILHGLRSEDKGILPETVFQCLIQTLAMKNSTSAQRHEKHDGKVSPILKVMFC